MTNITNFNFKDSNLRTITIDNNPYFCVADLRNILNIEQRSSIIQDLKDGFIKNELTDNLGRKQQSYFCNEKDLYKITLRSNSKVAEPFQDWVCGEVLPQLRKTGKYEIANTCKNQNIQYKQKNCLYEPKINEINLNEINYKKYIDFFKKHFSNYIVQLLYVKMFIKNKIFMLGVSRNIRILDIIFHTIIEQHQAPMI